MAEDRINPVEAKALREAFKRTAEIEPFDEEKSVKCDEVEICSTMRAGPRDPYFLTVRRDGKDVAHVPITSATLKRLKGQVNWWKSIRSGAGFAFRHGNRP